MKGLPKQPENKTKVSGGAAAKALKLLDMLDENDDVQNVSTNAEFDEADLEQS